MEVYRCTLHLKGGDTRITSNWNTSKYWARQQALKYINDKNEIGHVSYDTYVIHDGNEIVDCSKSTVSDLK